MNNKKVLIILSSALVLLIILIIIVLNLQQGGGDNQNQDTQNQGINRLKVNQLFNEPVTALFAQKDGVIKFYSLSDGALYQNLFSGGQTTKISGVKLNGVVSAEWSFDGSQSVVRLDSNGRSNYYLYDYSTGETVNYDPNVSKIVFSPNQSNIAYLFYDPAKEEGNISIADATAQNWKNIFSTVITDWSIDWPSENLISLLTLPSGLAQSALYIINPNTLDYELAISDLYGLTAKVSPDGKKVIYSYTDSKGENIKTSLSNIDGSDQKEMQFITLADKCVFTHDSKKIICGAITNYSDETLPDDYYMGMFKSNDAIIQYNTENSQTISVLPLSEAGPIPIDVSEPTLSPEEDYLFFINRWNGRPYSLPLQ